MRHYLSIVVVLGCASACEGPSTAVVVPLSVVNWYPSGNATCVPRETGVWITFSEPIDQETLTTDAVALLAGTTAVLSSHTFDADTLTIELWPDAVLDLATTYTVRLSQSVRAQSGATLGVNVASQFTTVAQTGCAVGLECRVHADCVPQRCSVTGVCVDECAVPLDCPPGEQCTAGACTP